jgi:hypothetical protein
MLSTVLHPSAKGILIHEGSLQDSSFLAIFQTMLLPLQRQRYVFSQSFSQILSLSNNFMATVVVSGHSALIGEKYRPFWVWGSPQLYDSLHIRSHARQGAGFG